MPTWQQHPFPSYHCLFPGSILALPRTPTGIATQVLLRDLKLTLYERGSYVVKRCFNAKVKESTARTAAKQLAGTVVIPCVLEALMYLGAIAAQRGKVTPLVQEQALVDAANAARSQLLALLDPRMVSCNVYCRVLHLVDARYFTLCNTTDALRCCPTLC